MKYSTIELMIDREEAHKRIANRVKGISIKEEETRYIYRTLSGFQLATLTEI